MDDVYLLVLKHIKQFVELSTLYHVKVYRETMFSIDMAYVVDRQINKYQMKTSVLRQDKNKTESPDEFACRKHRA